jgi:hypothetical protein
MSKPCNKKRGCKPGRSKKTKQQKQQQRNKDFQAVKDKEMQADLKDNLHVVMVTSDRNYKWAIYSDKEPKKMYGKFSKVCWLLRQWYFRTLNKGVRVNLLYQDGFREKDGMVWMRFSGKKEVMLDAKNTKKREYFEHLFLSRRYLEARKKVLV